MMHPPHEKCIVSTSDPVARSLDSSHQALPRPLRYVVPCVFNARIRATLLRAAFYIASVTDLKQTVRRGAGRRRDRQR